MTWVVEITDEFDPEFDAMHEDVQTQILAYMKELRFSAAGGEWRIAFAFDTRRRAILLVAADESGVSGKKFYRELIRKADDRLDAHLARLKKERK